MKEPGHIAGIGPFFGTLFKDSLDKLYEGISIKSPATLPGDILDASNGARRLPGLLPRVAAS